VWTFSLFLPPALNAQCQPRLIARRRTLLSAIARLALCRDDR
jgi:hypothetical protein